MTDNKILIVDDSQVIREIIKNELNDHSIQSDLASNGKEAMKLVKEHEYSLIFLDINMPEVNGIEFLTHLKDENILTPCVVISSEEDIECTLKCKKLGAKAWLKKPVNTKTLLQVYTRLVVEQENKQLF